MKLNELEAVLEAILFVSGDAVALSVLADAIEMDKATTKAIVKSLAAKYEQEQRGLRIVEVEGAYQMCTAASCYDYIRSMYQNVNRQGLTQSLMETLAIIAYKQPITKAQIEEIRGVTADHAVNKLMERGLVQEVGRMDAVGRPMLFGTTKEFLRYFGFTSKAELPSLEEGQAEEQEETREEEPES